MSLLSVHSALGVHHIEVMEGQSVREALDASTWRVRAACGGTGACGACLVRVIEGEVSTPTVVEYTKLTPQQRATGARLACQLRLTGNAAIRMPRPAPPSPWKSIPPLHLRPLAACKPHPTQHPLGVAVDLGTTQIRVALLDRQHGRRIATRYGPNPQAVFGADVLNRLAAARAHPQQAEELAKQARNAILQAVRDILARDVGEIKSMLTEIGRVVVVGNTAMLALLAGRGVGALLDPACWQHPIDCRAPDSPDWRQKWSMPHAEIVLLDPVAGFIGSDLVADLSATGLTDGPAGSALIDIGTNTEIALWDGNQLYVTSVAGGPAFEGVGIRNGMAAEPGAIQRIQPTADGYRFETLDGAQAKGFCGSGLVDAIALLRAEGRLKISGRFAVPLETDGYRLDPANPRTAVIGPDVDLFQRAKAATAAAMAHLLARAGMGWRDLRRLCVCGAFGHTLHLGHAQAVGLLPPLDPEVIELHANASLSGCEQALLSAGGPDRFAALAAKITVLNLSLAPDYEDRYIDHLPLRPIALNSGARATSLDSIL